MSDKRLDNVLKAEFISGNFPNVSKGTVTNKFVSGKNTALISGPNI